MEKPSNNSQQIYGLRPVIEAIESGARIERVYLQSGLGNHDGGPKKGLGTDLVNRLREGGIPFQFVPAEKLDRLARGNHQGVVATLAAVAYRSALDLLPALAEEKACPLVVLLDHITDVRNMGAIARTAECTGVDALVVPDRGSAAINQDAIKTSSGALLRLPLCREANFKTVVNLAKQCGYQVVAATEKGTVHYRQVDFRRPTLLILGNEETGISSEMLKISDIRAKLPIVGEVASLNVSVAAGVFMYEALEQRGM